MMPAAVKWRRIFVNDGCTLDHLPFNRHTWKFACYNTYMVMNFYSPDWLVSGNALEVYRVPADSLEAARTYMTIAAALEVKP
jgi:hypothetical protein